MKLQKKYIGIIFFIIAMLGFFYLYNQTLVHNYLGEKLFLKYHLHNSSILVLENLPESKKNSYSYHLLGRLYFVENNLRLSIKNFTLAIEKNNEDMLSYYGRGLAYGFHQPQIFLTYAQNDFEKYIELEKEEFRQSGRRAYGAWAGYNDLAWIHFLKGDFVAQEKTARAGLEISTSNAWLQNILGVALLAQKKCSEAKKHLEIAKKLAENKSVEEFGEAYSGDQRLFWESGLVEMKKIIVDNLKLCKD